MFKKLYFVIPIVMLGFSISAHAQFANSYGPIFSDSVMSQKNQKVVKKNINKKYSRKVN